MTEKLIAQMIKYYNGDPKRIQHFIKVHSFAKQIGLLEKMDKEELYTLETAAVVHDIGIRYCEEHYGKCNGKLQEQEGPTLARKMLEELGYNEKVTQRVCYLVGHHHTYDHIDGLDYQILIEADFLVNLFEDDAAKETVQITYDKIFKTTTGRTFCKEMFGL